MFYSKSIGGFYSPDIHTTMPYDVVEITNEQYHQLLTSQSQGMVIVGDANGYPIAVTPTVTPEQIKQARIAEIKARLSAIDIDAIRPLRAIATGTATQFDTDKLASLDAEADALRAELKELLA